MYRLRRFISQLICITLSFSLVSTTLSSATLPAVSYPGHVSSLFQADRITATGIVQGTARQQIQVSGGNASRQLGNLSTQGIHAGSNDVFSAQTIKEGQAALDTLLQSGVISIANPEIKAALKQVSSLEFRVSSSANEPSSILSGTLLNPQPETRNSKPETQLVERLPQGQIQLTVAGQAKVQQLYSHLRLSETFEEKKFTNQQTAQLVTLTVAIALTVFTAGAGASALFATLGTIGSAVATAATIAFVSTTVGQMAGGASFSEAFQAGIKSAAVSAITAGATSAIGDAIGNTTLTGKQAVASTDIITSTNNASNLALNSSSLTDKFLDKAIGYTVRAGVSTATNKLIYGSQAGNTNDIFTNSLVSSASSDLANFIGDKLPSGSISHIAAHAGLGCAAAAASKQDCASGAIGAGSSALLTSFLSSPTDDKGNARSWTQAEQALIAVGATLAGGAISSALGKDALTGANAAANEVTNNYLKHSEINSLQKELASCNGDTDCQRNIWKLYNKISTDREASQQGCNDANTCRAARVEVQVDQQELFDRQNELLEKSKIVGLTSEEKQEYAYNLQNLARIDGDLQQVNRQFRNVTPYDQWTTQEKEQAFTDVAMTVGGLAGAAAITRQPTTKATPSGNTTESITSTKDIATTIKANIAESAAARNASNFSEYAAKEQQLQNTLALGKGPLNELAVNDYGVALFGKDNLGYYTREGATIGREGRSFFFMPLEDSAMVKDAGDAARYTGMAPSARKAYVEGGDIFGLSFSTQGKKISVPTAIDAGGYEHFLEGGRTAVRLEGQYPGYLLNPTREFVIPGGSTVPTGSVLFKLGPNGEWIPIRKF